MAEFHLESYLTNGVERIVKGIWKASLKNPTAGIFMLQYLNHNKEANSLRKRFEEEGQHIPPFLIASITTSCNLHCKGCYARANHNCFDEADDKNRMLTETEWGHIFDEAQELGISFILLAGGEPMLRQDVLRTAGLHKKILFPVFTNGTMFSEETIRLFAANPNLLPVLSIEGEQEITDSRRGEGTYDKLIQDMDELKKREIVFGSSVTVQKDNMQEVMGDIFLKSLIKKGCKAVVYVEYVPVNSDTTELAPDEADRTFMKNRLTKLREKYPELVFVSFPGDEKTSGGCLAAGRGFFHINACGGAEPCPFSAYSDTSLKDVSLRAALDSPLFRRLQDSGTLITEHRGGCVLFEQEETVKVFCQESREREEAVV
ncbi:MAG: radical SAM protein [Hespellia sp.]|nr:radical SAM protein [Hespellia sp.]